MRADVAAGTAARGPRVRTRVRGYDDGHDDGRDGPDARDRSVVARTAPER